VPLRPLSPTVVDLAGFSTHCDAVGQWIRSLSISATDMLRRYCASGQFSGFGASGRSVRCLVDFYGGRRVIDRAVEYQFSRATAAGQYLGHEIVAELLVTRCALATGLVEAGIATVSYVGYLDGIETLVRIAGKKGAARGAFNALVMEWHGSAGALAEVIRLGTTPH
jgi:hypothetical protein